MSALVKLCFFSTHLNKPWLELVIDYDVIPITLETVLVVVHHRLGERERERELERGTDPHCA